MTINMLALFSSKRGGGFQQTELEMQHRACQQEGTEQTLYHEKA